MSAKRTDKSSAAPKVESQVGRFGIVTEWIASSSASDRAIRLYSVLSSRATQQHEAYPARSTLARIMRCSTKSIDRAVEELCEIGALQVKRRKQPSGDFMSNLYLLRLRRPDLAEGRVGADAMLRDLLLH